MKTPQEIESLAWDRLDEARISSGTIQPTIIQQILELPGNQE